MIQSIKPCVLNNGSVSYYLNKDNYTQKEDGGTADLTGGAGDVMVEIPKIGYRLWNDENYQYVSVTTASRKTDYCYYAHSLNFTGDCDKIYYGAYLGYVDGNNLYSRSGIAPTADTSLVDFRTYAANRGTGYSLEQFFPRTLMQCLYVVMYKNLNSQEALGKGYTNASDKANTGATNNNTFCYGDPNDGTKHIKFLGIEDFWGNLNSWLDGIYCDDSWNILTDYRNSQFTSSGHDFQFSTPSGLSDNFYFDPIIKSIQGTNISGFIPKSFYDNDNYNTYFSDEGSVSPYLFGACGGSWFNNVFTGAFRFFNYSASIYHLFLGARLIYKHVG